METFQGFAFTERIIPLTCARLWSHFRPCLKGETLARAQPHLTRLDADFRKSFTTFCPQTKAESSFVRSRRESFGETISSTSDADLWTVARQVLPRFSPLSRTRTPKPTSKTCSLSKTDLMHVPDLLSWRLKAILVGEEVGDNFELVNRDLKLRS